MEQIIVRMNDGNEIIIEFRAIDFLADSILPSTKVWLTKEQAGNLADMIIQELKAYDYANCEHKNIVATNPESCADCGKVF